MPIDKSLQKLLDTHIHDPGEEYLLRAAELFYARATGEVDKIKGKEQDVAAMWKRIKNQLEQQEIVANTSDLDRWLLQESIRLYQKKTYDNIRGTHPDLHGEYRIGLETIIIEQLRNNLSLHAVGELLLEYQEARIQTKI